MKKGDQFESKMKRVEGWRKEKVRGRKDEHDAFCFFLYL